LKKLFGVVLIMSKQKTKLKMLNTSGSGKQTEGNSRRKRLLSVFSVAEITHVDRTLLNVFLKDANFVMSPEEINVMFRRLKKNSSGEVAVSDLINWMDTMEKKKKKKEAERARKKHDEERRRRERKREKRSKKKEKEEDKKASGNFDPRTIIKHQYSPEASDDSGGDELKTTPPLDETPAPSIPNSPVTHDRNPSWGGSENLMDRLVVDEDGDVLDVPTPHDPLADDALANLNIDEIENVANNLFHHQLPSQLPIVHNSASPFVSPRHIAIASMNAGMFASHMSLPAPQQLGMRPSVQSFTAGMNPYPGRLQNMSMGVLPPIGVPSMAPMASSNSREIFSPSGQMNAEVGLQEVIRMLKNEDRNRHKMAISTLEYLKAQLRETGTSQEQIERLTKENDNLRDKVKRLDSQNAIYTESIRKLEKKLDTTRDRRFEDFQKLSVQYQGEVKQARKAAEKWKRAHAEEAHKVTLLLMRRKKAKNKNRRKRDSAPSSTIALDVKRMLKDEVRQMSRPPIPMRTVYDDMELDMGDYDEVSRWRSMPAGQLLQPDYELGRRRSQPNSGMYAQNPGPPLPRSSFPARPIQRGRTPGGPDAYYSAPLGPVDPSAHPPGIDLNALPPPQTRSSEPLPPKSNPLNSLAPPPPKTEPASSPAIPRHSVPPKVEESIFSSSKYLDTSELL